MTKAGKDFQISETVQSLRRVFKAIQDYSQEVSSAYGITGPQLWALKTIAAEDALPLGLLSKKMYLHPSTVTGVVDRLEAKGYVTRSRDPNDRRVINVQLTTEGKKVVKKAPSPVQGKLIYGLKNLKQDELNVIYQSVLKLVEIVDAKHVKATFFFDKE